MEERIETKVAFDYEITHEYWNLIICLNLKKSYVEKLIKPSIKTPEKWKK